MELEQLYVLFYNNKDIESNSGDIEIGVARPIFTQIIPESLWDNNIHTLQYWRKILCQLMIFMEPELFPYYFVITKTLNFSRLEYN